MRHGATTAIVTLAIGALPAVAAAQFAEQPPVDPATYRSPSGRFALHVEPGDRDGKGAAEYTLVDNGKVRWEGKREFTLFEASVSDTGLVAGYAYSAGLYSGYDRSGCGDLRILGLDASGRTLFEHSGPRVPSHMEHEERAVPYGVGLLLDSVHDRLLVRVEDGSPADEFWLTYRLSTGEALDPINPLSLLLDSPDQGSVLDAQLVPGVMLPLVATRDWSADGDRSRARCWLLDASSRPVWSVEIPQAPLPERWPGEGAVGYVNEHGPFLSTGASTFTLVFPTTEEAVSYRVSTDDAAGVEVEETGRRRFVPPAEDDWLAALPQGQATFLGSILLQHRGAASPLRGVTDFEIDDQGRFGFLRQDAEGTRFVLLDRGGAVLRQVRVDPGELGVDARAFLAWCGGSRWLVAWTVFDPVAATGWWLDADTGELTPIPAFPSADVDALAGRRDGGFVVLVTVDSPSMSGEGVFDLGKALLSFGASGTEEWRADAALAADDDVAVTPAGRVGVIGSLEKVVQVFGPEGELESTVELQKALGHEPTYPAGISADVEEGFACEDFDAEKPWVRIDAAGRVRSEWAPHYADGSPTGRLFRLRLDPAGRLWGTDGEALLRLDDSGVVDHVVGTAPSASDLGEIAAVALDAKNRIYAVDRRTGSVHVFGADGMPQRVLAVEPGEIEEQLDLTDLTVAWDGRVCVDVGNVIQHRHVCFGPDGRRIPPIEREVPRGWDAEAENGTWWFEAGTGDTWVEDRTHFDLRDADGKLLRRLEKRADGRWLRSLPHLAPCTTGGAMAVHGQTWGGDGVKVDVYAPDGSARAGFDLPAGAAGYEVACGGGQVALWHSGALVVFDLDRTTGVRLEPSVRGRALKDLPVFFADDGREVWLFEGAASALHRFALPAFEAVRSRPGGN